MSSWLVSTFVHQGTESSCDVFFVRFFFFFAHMLCVRYVLSYLLWHLADTLSLVDTVVSCRVFVVYVVLLKLFSHRL